MVEGDSDRLDGVFQALADPTRRAMLAQLAQGERSIGQLAAPHRMSFAGASKHVRVLERAGLVRRTVRGRSHLCRLSPEPLADANAWLRAYRPFWGQRLGALEQMLQEEGRAEADRDAGG